MKSQTLIALVGVGIAAATLWFLTKGGTQSVGAGLQGAGDVFNPNAFAGQQPVAYVSQQAQTAVGNTASTPAVIGSFANLGKALGVVGSYPALALNSWLPSATRSNPNDPKHS